MNVKILAYRSSTRASVWFVDAIQVIVGVLSAFCVLAFLSLLDRLGVPVVEHLDWLPRWTLAAFFVAAGCWTTRLRISGRCPREVSLAWFWTVIPLRRYRCPINAVTSRHADDFTVAKDAPHDELVLGDRELDCRRADRVAAWLWESAGELATPRADLKA